MHAEDMVSTGGDVGVAGILLLMLYGFIIAFHNTCCYRAAKSLSFDTFNRRRLQLTTRHYVATVGLFSLAVLCEAS